MIRLIRLNKANLLEALITTKTIYEFVYSKIENTILTTSRDALFAALPSGYHSTFLSPPIFKMRASLPATLLLSVLLTACASKGDIPPSKHISQSGTLRVHPGLLGEPVPAELQADLRPSGAATGAQADNAIRMDPVGLRTQRSVYFDYNSADIKSDFAPALKAHAGFLAQNPQARIRIEGNADERGSTEFNRRLGLKRAEAVRDAMLGQGALEKQIRIKTLGESKPKLTGRDEESWAENRRADVVYEAGE